MKILNCQKNSKYVSKSQNFKRFYHSVKWVVMYMPYGTKLQFMIEETKN